MSGTQLTTGDHPRRWRAALLTLVIAALAFAAFAFDPALPPASAAEGLTEETHARYVVGGDGTVTAEVRTTITNVTPDQGAQYFYWTDYRIGVPASATNIHATSGGSSLLVTIDEDEQEPDQHWAFASFAPLRYQQSRTIEWTYQIEGAPLRSEEWTRVGPGYAVFAAQATGDDGTVSVEVVAPRDLEFHASSEFESDRDGQQMVYRSEEYSDEWGVWSAVSLRDPDESEAVEIPVDGVVTLSVESLPGDDAWREFAVDRIETGLPVLEELVGAPWPAEIRHVREDVSPHVLGYAWFDDIGNEIVVGEELDESTLYHELGHAWFAPPAFSGRWLYEGLTEVTAQRAIAIIGGDGSTARHAPDPEGEGALPLTEWSETDQRTEHDTYGYPASYTAIDAILGDLDDETFGAVIAAAYAGEGAYEHAGSTAHNGGPVDWQRFLDLAAERGGVDGTEAYREWVLPEQHADILEDRLTAREHYADLDAVDQAWQPPLGLRTAMTEWDFAASEDTITRLAPVSESAARVHEEAERTGLAVPEPIRAAYEDAESEEDYATLETLLPQAAAVIEQVSASTTTIAAENDPVTEFGEALLQANRTVATADEALAAGDLDRAQLLAESAAAQAAWATWLGVAFIAGVAIVLVLLVLAVRALIRRSRATSS
ncbi:hypothetical protein [Ruania halotolerans]|uniref:hypothetical protein n=1 Tax=Ruania halotolerans TaxID=2897773 RepID=UPI001E5D8EC1|nr:hypothetical protein [Ruania halotolerans]UFU07354.1 hypothetical protein LQF10_04375 [Ruania halotolerans]